MLYHTHRLFHLRSWGFVITSKVELAFLMGEVPGQVYPSSVTAPGRFSSTIPVSLGASFHADPAGRELQVCLPASKATPPPRKCQDVSGTPAEKSWAKGRGLNYRTLMCPETLKCLNPSPPANSPQGCSDHVLPQKLRSHAEIFSVAYKWFIPHFYST